MKLITEVVDTTHVLEEDASGKKSLYITGPFLQADVGNKNGRIYPSSVLDPEVERYITEKVDKNCAWGELNHPATASINMDRVSHRIVSLVKEGSTWIGKAKVGKGPMGEIVRHLIEDGGNLGVSSRALGDLKKRQDGLMEVNGLRLMTAADIVSDPSGPGCFVNGIMENVNFWYDEKRGQYVQEFVEDTKKELKKWTTKQIQEAKVTLFEQFLEKLSKNNK